LPKSPKSSRRAQGIPTFNHESQCDRFLVGKTCFARLNDMKGQIKHSGGDSRKKMVQQLNMGYQLFQCDNELYNTL
jgi:hypothetical protein